MSNNPAYSGYYDFDKTEYYNLRKNIKYQTGETRAMLTTNVDPLQLNYKLMIDYSNPVGLFSDETNVDSALAYLKRIGEDNRYEMLKRWIYVFKVVIKDFDFLFNAVEGLEVINNWKQGTYSLEDDKLQFKMRETSDMLIQSLLVTYRQIIFDDVRGVEVLPTNLKKFNCSVIVFSAGYYNMQIYDNGKSTTSETNSNVLSKEANQMIFPTLRKLDEMRDVENARMQFNHTIYHLMSCKIDEVESGKQFVENVLNEQNPEVLFSNIAITWKHQRVSGVFNNIYGNTDFGAVLALASAQSRLVNANVFEGSASAFREKLADLSYNLRGFGNPKGITDGIVMGAVGSIKSRLDKIDDRLLGNTSVAGNIISKLTAKNLVNLVKNTIDLGLDYVEQKVIIDPITKLNKMIFQNFSNNIYDLYNNVYGQKTPSNVTLAQEKIIVGDNIVSQSYVAPQSKQIDNSVKLGKYNVFKTPTF